MKISFLLNKSLLNKVNVSSVHLIYSNLLFDKEYLNFYLSKPKGIEYYQVGESINNNLMPDIDVMLFDSDFIHSIKTIKKYAKEKRVGVILKNNNSLFRVEQEYKKWSSLDFISDIAIPLNIGKVNDNKLLWKGTERIKFFKNLVNHNTFSFRIRHHLYGLSNPIELMFYHKRFSNVVYSKFEVVFCASALINSIYGMDFSEIKGLYYAPVDISADMERSYLGLLPYFGYELGYYQRKKFFSNCDILLNALHSSLEIDEIDLKVVHE